MKKDKLKSLSTKDTHEAFLVEIEKIKGFYSDGIQAFHHFNEWLNLSRVQALEVLKKNSPELANDEYLDKRLYTYSEEASSFFEKNETENCKHILISYNTATQGEVRARNKDGGENYHQLGNFAIIMIYQLWEHKYRLMLSSDKENLLESDIFGDLRIIRHCILHNKGVLDKTLKIVTILKNGELILINKLIFIFILSEIEKFLKSILEKD